jgi:uncharacterized membrane protein
MSESNPSPISDPINSDPVFTNSGVSQAPEVPKAANPVSEEVQLAEAEVASPQAHPSEPKPSYVKLAMRNMVRKRGKSLYHFTLTTIGLLTLLVGLAYLTR